MLSTPSCRDRLAWVITLAQKGTCGGPRGFEFEGSVFGIGILHSGIPAIPGVGVPDTDIDL